MGLKITIETELPLTKDEAETLSFASMMLGTIASARIADFDPPSPNKVCGALDPNVDPERETSICTYVRGHEGRHRFINFGRTKEE